MDKDYRLIYSKRKTLALIIERDASLTVRAPKRASMAEISRFIDSRQDWIKKKIFQQEKENMNKKQKLFQDGEMFLYLGNEYSLRLVDTHYKKLEFSKEFLLSNHHQESAQELFIQWYKEQSIVVFPQRVAMYAKEMGSVFKYIRITSAQHQLGSCTSKKTLNFPWRLLMAPMEVVDYVVVHELAHLEQMNHSKEFWRRVSGVYPRYQSAKAWIKENSTLLYV